MLLAQLLLRPIHVIRSGLTRLGKGEFGVTPRPAAGRRVRRARHLLQRGQRAAVGGRAPRRCPPATDLESAVEQPRGRGRALQPDGRAAVLQPGDAARCCRTARRSAEPRCRSCWPTITRCAQLVEETLASAPVARAASRCAGRRRAERAAAHDATRSTTPTGELVGVMLVARNLGYLSQVQSTLNYSRKLAALGRLTAGVAHEVKNPLNAMMIHLELLQAEARARVPRAGRRAGGARRGAGSRDAVGRRPSTSTSSPTRSGGSTRWCRVPEVRAARGSEAAAGARCRRVISEIVPIVEPEARARGT